MCGGDDMLNKPMNGAKKRASLLKQIQAFKKCAEGIVDNGMEETDQSLFKPNKKKARLEKIGSTTRMATIKASINLTKEAQIEVSKALLTMQKDHSPKALKIRFLMKSFSTLLNLTPKGSQNGRHPLHK